MSNNATRAGLVKTGDKDEGRDVFIGTKEQWEAYEEMIENEVNDCLMSPDCSCDDCKREDVWMDR